MSALPTHVQVVYPALDSKVKNVTSAYSVEHEDEERLFEQLSTLLSAALQQSGKERTVTLRQLECKIEEVHITLKKHLAKEEEQLFPLLLKHFTFAEQVITKQCQQVFSCSLQGLMQTQALPCFYCPIIDLTQWLLLQAELVAQFLCCIPLAAVEVVLAWLKPVVPEDEQQELLGHVSARCRIFALPKIECLNAD